MRRGPGLTKDVRFISDLIDDLEKAYNIDPTRIYANGLSNGGGMAFVLSCTLSDRIAAVGMVAAAQMLPWSWCTDHRPVPMIAFHGTADSIVPYEGGTSWVAPDARFPTFRSGRRAGLDGTGAGPTPSNRRWQPTSPAGTTRTVPTTRPSCSSRFTAEAIRGRAASLCRSGSSDPRTTRSTRRSDVGVLSGAPAWHGR